MEFEVARRYTLLGWLAGWDHRKSLTITGSSDGALTLYQFPIKVYFGAGVDGTEVIGDTTWGKVYTDSRCETDFADIRFTTDDEETLLDYWIEYFADSSYALIWVEVDSIPQDPDTVDIYIYYGNNAVGTTSSMENTWVDSFDWSSDLTGDFTLYTSGAVQERAYLQSTTLELPMRAITHLMITDYLSDLYGANPGWGATKNADDTRDADDYIVQRFSGDTSHGADADTIAEQLVTDDGGVPTGDFSPFDFALDTIYVAELRGDVDTPSEAEVFSAGRAARLADNIIADAPDSINYVGYISSYTGGSEQDNYWGYNAVDDRVIWGGRRDPNDGLVKLEAPFSVFGKWTQNEPVATTWGPEQALTTTSTTSTSTTSTSTTSTSTSTSTSTTLPPCPRAICLWVDGFGAEHDKWTKVGGSPYLDWGVADYVYDGDNTDDTGDYTFEDTVQGGTPTVVEVAIYCKREENFETITVWIDDGVGGEQNAGIITPDAAYSWKTLDVSVILDTFAKINAAKMRVVLNV